MTAPQVCVVNLGCRVNRVESDRMAEGLAEAGFTLGGEDEAALIVINTCAVTGEAEAKTRKAVRHALAEPQEPIVVVTGCAVNLHPGEFAALSARVVEEPLKNRVPARAIGLIHANLAETDDFNTRIVAETESYVSTDEANLAETEQADCENRQRLPLDPVQFLGRSRLGVKIQDGCDNRCSYCIVWKARGPERSEAPDGVLAQVRAAAAGGVPEVVLTGVNLAAYRWDLSEGGVLGLDGLLRRILDETDIPQVRLSSLEPLDVTPDLVEVMAARSDRVAPFLHLPLQSGCTATLRRMRRPYTAERYAEVVDMVRSGVPSIALACDVIVGFPGETDEEFEESYAFCERMGFSRMHVFRYSARPGTPAAEAPNQVPPQVMAERSRRLRELGQRLARADAFSRIGTCERAVLEDGAQGTLGSFHRVVVDDLLSAGAPLSSRRPDAAEAASDDCTPLAAGKGAGGGGFAGASADDRAPEGTPSPGGSAGVAEPAARLVDVAIMSLDDDGLLHGRIVHQD